MQTSVELLEKNLTPVNWIVKQYEEKFGKHISRMMQEEILEANMMEGREMVKYLYTPVLLKVYDPIDPNSTIKSHIIDAYNAGHEDATCNHINDAEQYYNQKYRQNM
jgi:hypothetical protein